MLKRGLIISSVAKATEFFQEMMSDTFTDGISCCKTGVEARMALAEDDYDLVVVNHPLADGTGESTAKYVGRKAGTQVIFMVKAENCQGYIKDMEQMGIFTVSKPTNRGVFSAVLQAAKVTHCRVATLEQDNQRLRQKLDDIKIVDRAKYRLISQFAMTEEQAHRYIEKQAMDLRVSRRKVAENILKVYEY